MRNDDTRKDHGAEPGEERQRPMAAFLASRPKEGREESNGGVAIRIIGRVVRGMPAGAMGALAPGCRIVMILVLALMVLSACLPGKAGAGGQDGQEGQSEVVPLDDWAGLQTYALEIIDPDWPPGKTESPIRIHGVTGQEVGKELIVYNFSPRIVEDVVLRLGFSKQDTFPPTKLPAPVVFTGLPDSWEVSPRQVLVGRMLPEEKVRVNITATLGKVGRYRLLLIATGDDPEDEDNILLRQTISLELEKAKGHSSRITAVRLMVMAMLAVCGGILINKKRG